MSGQRSESSRPRKLRKTRMTWSTCSALAPSQLLGVPSRRYLPGRSWHGRMEPIEGSNDGWQCLIPTVQKMYIHELHDHQSHDQMKTGDLQQNSGELSEVLSWVSECCILHNFRGSGVPRKQASPSITVSPTTKHQSAKGLMLTPGDVILKVHKGLQPKRIPTWRWDRPVAFFKALPVCYSPWSQLHLTQPADPGAHPGATNSSNSNIGNV